MKIIEQLTKPADPDWLIKLLGSWKLWLIGAVLGAAAGFIFGLIFPADYSAAAGVMIDQNVEQVIPIGRDSDLYLYLARETRKLEAFAWSDDVLSEVAAAVPGFTIEELRSDYLELSPPGDGEWHLAARHSEAETAEAMAKHWALGFEKVLVESAEVSIRMEQLRAGLIDEAQQDPLDWEVIQTYLDEYFVELDKTSGISPYLEMELSQLESIQAEPIISTGLMLLLGSVFGFAAAFLYGMVNLTGGPRS